MASNAMELDTDNGIAIPQKTASSSSAAPVTQAVQSIASTQRYKYKYPEAYPTPDGEDDEVWNKLFTAADSRLYNKHGKNANESKKYRASGATRELALKMLQEKKEKLATETAGGSAASSSKTSTPKPNVKKTTTIKKEPSTSSRDATPLPSTDKMSTMSISEKIKSGGRARNASSVALSDHDAPGPPTASAIIGSPAPPAPKVEKPKKKGTAAPIKKRGIKPKSEGTNNNPSNSNMAPGIRTGSSSDDESNDGGEYCTCRGPDDHRMMVYCDGGCNDWYHCSCVGIEEADAKELLDRFICPKCKTDTLFTTWKRFCRYGNVGKFTKDPNLCRKAARVSDDPPSKYCSDAHKDMFWVWVRDHLARKDDEPAVPGGRLSVGEVGWILKQCKTIEEIQALGKKPKLPINEGADPNNPPGLDYLKDDDADQLYKITARRGEIEEELLLYKNREKLRTMIVARAEKAAAHLEVKIKDVCGYDSRLATNKLEFALWSKSEEGKCALETGVLGPRTAETKAIGAHILLPAQSAPEVSAVPQLADICIKKKCIKHRDWAATYKSDIANAHYMLTLEKKRLIVKKGDLISEAETTEAMRPEYEDNVTVQLF